VNQQLRFNREALRLSQSHLARLSGVSRFKICLYELGDRELSADELARIGAALIAETERLRQLPATPTFAQRESVTA
jgi:transcriptional regulator with XRE-family HTH domain